MDCKLFERILKNAKDKKLSKIKKSKIKKLKIKNVGL